MFTQLIEKENKLKQAQEHAVSKGGLCLSNEYIKSSLNMEWKCSKNHIWHATYNNIINGGKWCRQCSFLKIAEDKKNKNGLKIAKTHAESKGGQCLSTEYKNSNSKMEWKCHNPAHDSWKATYQKVKGGTWCPYCKGNFSKEDVIKRAKTYAESKGGECLSIEYKNANSKMEWKCSNLEHLSWKATYQKVKDGTWCPKCAKEKKRLNPLGLIEAQKYAEAKGGKCLSTEYQGSNLKIEWKCNNIDHDSWMARFSHTLRGSWCPQCFGKFPKEKKLIKAQQFAISKGGKCLSDEYNGANSPMEWKCSENHHKSWMATYSNITRGLSWCPECSFYHYKEHKIRAILEYLLNTKFIKVKPSWNINPKTNRLLELDGFSQELNIAFEFQGNHHYSENAFLNSNEDFLYIQYKDKIKKQNCQKQGVKLLIIDDNFKLNEIEKIVITLQNILIQSNISFISNIDQTLILKIINQPLTIQSDYLNKAKKHAETKGGKLLSTEYNDSQSKLEWKCADLEHSSWFATYSKVINSNHWCPQCGGHFSKEEGLLRAQKYAESKNGKCLSTEYNDSNSKMEWKCSNLEHPSWFNTYSKIIHSHRWCFLCAKK